MDAIPVDRIHLRAGLGSETITLEPAPFGRDGHFHMRIEPDDQLDAGYYEAFARLDTQSLGRLLYWLRTGVALERNDPRIPEPFTEGREA